MFRIPAMSAMTSMTTGRLLKYGLLAFASQHLFRKGMQRYASNRTNAGSRSGLGRSMRSNNVDTASQDSFPASDPPSFTGTVGPLPG